MKSIFGYLENDSGAGGHVKRELARHEEWTEAILPADAEADTPEGVTDRRPLKGMAALAVLLVGGLVFRLFYLQIIDGANNLALANGNRIRERVERAPRGEISDRYGTVLARNQANSDLVVVPQLLPEDKAARQAEYQTLSGIIGMPVADIAAKSETSCQQHKPDACLKDPVPQLVASGLDRDKALLSDQASATLPGFSLDVNPIREYKDNNLLSAFLGYTGRVSAEELAADDSYGPSDLIGKLGIEKEYEKALRGANGGERTEVDASGRPVRILASRDSEPGYNLTLSIDFGLEQKLAENIKKQMDLAGAKRAAGVAIDPRNGEVLAAVSLPTYDNNAFSRGISPDAYQKLLSDPGQPLFNKVVSGAYPSGSIIKPLGASAALQENIITPSTTIEDTGQLDVVNPYDKSIHYIYKGWEHSGLGFMNLFSALARSSDIYFYTIAGGFTNFKHYLGVEKLTEYYKKFGLGSVTGVDVPGEAAGRVPTPEWKKKFSGEPWYTGDTYNISVGQGDLLVTPLQMAMATAAIANGGTLYQPHFLMQMTDDTKKVIQTEAAKVVGKGFISPENLSLVRQGMRQAVETPGGTACCIMEKQVPVHVAGKTGSAETDPANNVPAHSWFVSFSPYEDPHIVTVVLLEKAGEGAEFAVPATRETLAWYFTQGKGKQ